VKQGRLERNPITRRTLIAGAAAGHRHAGDRRRFGAALSGDAAGAHQGTGDLA
jgi:hypothetical protein